MAAPLPQHALQPMPLVTAMALARAAFASIQRHGLAPLPPYYAVWFEHHAGIRPQLSEALKAAIRAGLVNDTLMLELNARYLEHLPEISVLSEALTRLSGTLKEAMGSLDTHGADTAAFSDALDELSTGPAPDAERLREALSRLADEAREMARRSKRMSAQLAASTQQIEHLRSELHDARRDAMTDALTSLPNRRAFDETLQRMAAASQGNGEPLSLILVDIDHFKRVNDRFGHPAGDALLRRTASTIRNGLPLGGMVARFGGEEFAVLLPGHNLSTAIDEAERLRLEVSAQRHTMRHSGDRLNSITISLGLAELLRGDDLAAMMERADSALYRAKQEGRNRVCWEPVAADLRASNATMVTMPRCDTEKIWT